MKEIRPSFRRKLPWRQLAWLITAQDAWLLEWFHDTVYLAASRIFKLGKAPCRTHKNLMGQARKNFLTKLRIWKPRFTRTSTWLSRCIQPQAQCRYSMKVSRTRLRSFWIRFKSRRSSRKRWRTRLSAWSKAGRKSWKMFSWFTLQRGARSWNIIIKWNKSSKNIEQALKRSRCSRMKLSGGWRKTWKPYLRK